ncbi:MAG TPA: hypothetical protein ENL08_05590 [Bacteroidetes bacterium]|nr:hypothetical protein [Bacteroidota bacterium]
MEVDVVLEELALLIRLQEIDIELADIEAEKGDLPEQIEKLESEIAEYQPQVEAIENDLKTISGNRIEQSHIIDMAREQLKKSQSVIFNVKTTREYDAISTEIEQSKQKIAEGERLQLESLVNEEDLKKSLDELKDRLNKLHDELVERRSEMKERLDSTQEDELSFLHEREKIVHHLKKPVYDHYERTRKIRDGFGIAHVTGSACGYCYSKIPPQRLSEIKRMDDIILCEVCGCFLVYSPD